MMETNLKAVDLFENFFDSINVSDAIRKQVEETLKKEGEVDRNIFKDAHREVYGSRPSLSHFDT